MSKLLVIGLIIVMVIAITISFAQDLKPTFDSNDYQIKNYYVESGDTLYGLASQYCKDDDRVDEWIEAVKTLNRSSTSGLYANTRIKIYVPAD